MVLIADDGRGGPVFYVHISRDGYLISRVTAHRNSHLGLLRRVL